MLRLTRRNFLRVVILGGLAASAWTARRFENDLPPTEADPAVPEGAAVEITLRNGRIVRRICRGGYWVTAAAAS